ncbi:vasotab-like [Bacillus rossius redtenbacheri]|uniref:vasotab-like n=1 Tax=Bacillus rossius redtenbacheri TaxID=93214 RepID=UPI002FDE9CBF
MRFIAAILIASSLLVGSALGVAPQACPAVYDPVCAVSRWGSLRTFPNLCTLRAYNFANQFFCLKLLHRGECLSDRLF